MLKSPFMLKGPIRVESNYKYLFTLINPNMTGINNLY